MLSPQMTLDTQSTRWLFCLSPAIRPMVRGNLLRSHDNACQGPLFFWSYIYYLSKYYEFLDTVILALKGKPLSFLHVSHHALVCPMAYLWVDQAQSLQQVLVSLTKSSTCRHTVHNRLGCSSTPPSMWSCIIIISCAA